MRTPGELAGIPSAARQRRVSTTYRRALRIRMIATAMTATVITAACSDPSGPEPRLDPLASASPRSVGHRAIPSGTLPPPDVAFAVDGSTVEICASWSGDPLPGGTKLLYSFQLIGSGASETDLGSANARHNRTTGCIVRDDLGDGSHTIRVTATVRRGGGPNAELGVTEAAEVVVQIGDPAPPPIAYTIAIAPEEAAVLPGRTHRFTATVLANGEPIDGDQPALSWSSGDASIATVAADGLATGITPGSTAIRASLAADANVFADAALTVRPPPEPIVSTFEADSEGWTTVGDAATWISHEVSGGNPGSHIRLHEPGDGTTDRFVAPAKFLGDLSDYAGGTLSYDLRVNRITSPVPTPNDNVVLTGGGLTLYAAVPVPSAANTWSTYSVGLDRSAGWRVGSGVGELASLEQLDTVLSAVEGIWILADYRLGVELVDLDNVTIAPAPMP